MVKSVTVSTGKQCGTFYVSHYCSNDLYLVALMKRDFDFVLVVGHRWHQNKVILWYSRDCPLEIEFWNTNDHCILMSHKIMTKKSHDDFLVAETVPWSHHSALFFKKLIMEFNLPQIGKSSKNSYHTTLEISLQMASLWEWQNDFIAWSSGNLLQRRNYNDTL